MSEKPSPYTVPPDLLYLSGPMTGIEDFNYPAFDAAAARLRSQGFAVFNPAETFGREQGLRKSQYMEVDLAAVAVANKVVLLPGWKESAGARAEVGRAKELGIPCVEIWELMTHVPRIIGLTGYARSGKDTVAEMICELDQSFRRASFAEPLKQIATDIGWDGQKDEEGRVLLQNLGVSVRNRIGEDTWTNIVRDRIRTNDDLGLNTVITDVRFLNEIKMIRDMGGEIWRVDRPGVGPVNDHVSEHEWTGVVPDITVANGRDFRTLVELVAFYLGRRRVGELKKKWRELDECV